MGGPVVLLVAVGLAAVVVVGVGAFLFLGMLNRRNNPLGQMPADWLEQQKNVDATHRTIRS